MVSSDRKPIAYTSRETREPDRRFTLILRIECYGFISLFTALFGHDDGFSLRVRPESVQASLPGDHRDMEPPDPIPNSAVKRVLADGSVGYPHVRVGHRQALI